ncbi:Crp/Fnr family transcriptional regulator [Hydrogenophaga sp. BPS33]|uniref:Crp/Fnr family transcriptional regulator n=1 Tax=Hydrogenophaga sp. BPS33 TaxID=2651974 RepID=UPI001320201C|nr:Crp/Fnr family transcriptional regulator [Hydrogenophaga sp. BPS33]QHE86767.1 Crp/Fnr family transcriptional regulator [Hydrogenophaga sp. BPS33]
MTSNPTLYERNQLLFALSSADLEHIEPDLDWTEVHSGDILHATGDAVRHVYFPNSATVSLVSSLEDGASSELAVIGGEGMVGICGFMGAPAALCDAVVQRSGIACRMSTQALIRHSQRSPAFMQLLLGYTHALFIHMAQSSTCNRHHSLDQQLCRWLLQHLDRQGGGSDLTATQERIAGLLGVRREGVTSAALKLQKAGLIEYHRGRISILDRPGLEARSCECYGVVRRAYDQLSCSHTHSSGSQQSLAATVVVKRSLQSA